MKCKYELIIYQAALRDYKSCWLWKTHLVKALNEIISYHYKQKMKHPDKNDIVYIQSNGRLEYINNLLDKYVKLKFVHEVRERSIRGGGWPTIVSIKLPDEAVKSILAEYKKIKAQEKKDLQNNI